MNALENGTFRAMVATTTNKNDEIFMSYKTFEGTKTVVKAKIKALKGKSNEIQKQVRDNKNRKDYNRKFELETI